MAANRRVGDDDDRKTITAVRTMNPMLLPSVLLHEIYRSLDAISLGRLIGVNHAFRDTIRSLDAIWLALIASHHATATTTTAAVTTTTNTSNPKRRRNPRHSRPFAGYTLDRIPRPCVWLYHYPISSLSSAGSTATPAVMMPLLPPFSETPWRSATVPASSASSTAVPVPAAAASDGKGNDEVASSSSANSVVHSGYDQYRRLVHAYYASSFMHLRGPVVAAAATASTILSSSGRNRSSSGTGSDEIYKIIVVGERCVGRTSLVARLVHDRFDATPSPSVVEDDFGMLTVMHHHGLRVAVQAWDDDMSHMYKYQAMRSTAYYSGASIILLCFDVTSLESWHSILTYWYNEVERRADSNKLAGVILVGLKDDLPWYPHIQEEVHEFAQGHIPFVTCSAKTGDGVDYVYQLAVAIAHAARQLRNNNNTQASTPSASSSSSSPSPIAATATAASTTTNNRSGTTSSNATTPSSRRRCTCNNCIFID